MLTVLIDHDNVPFRQLSPIELLERLLDGVSGLLEPSGVVRLNIRAYGGWFQEAYVTDKRFHAAEFYQANLPTIFFYKGRPHKVAFAFADSLYARPGSDEGKDEVRITHTVALRRCYQHLTVGQGVPRCDVEGCELGVVRKWIRKRRACTKSECPRWFSDYFERQEQKQVDVHMALDFLLAAQQSMPGEHVSVVTDDWDMLPALAAASAYLGKGSLSMLRCRPSASYIDAYLESKGVRILNLAQ